ncbi:MAG: metal ABC transporter ATP-binding protein [Acidimicrobiia bacterium]
MALLQVTDVGYSFGNQQVFDDVNFSISAREFVALAGPNGAGKTTLMELLLGIRTLTSGTVTLSEELRSGRSLRIGYVPQRPAVSEDLVMTVEELVGTGRLATKSFWRPLHAADRSAVAHAIESVGLATQRTAQVGSLSGGQLQRAFIAKAFAADPLLLVLDEPVAGVDPESQQQFRDALMHLLREHGAAVLLVSHELGAVARDLDRVIVLRQRIVFDGPPEDLEARGVHLGIHDEDLPRWLEGPQT